MQHDINVKISCVYKTLFKVNLWMSSLLFSFSVASIWKHEAIQKKNPVCDGPTFHLISPGCQLRTLPYMTKHQQSDMSNSTQLSLCWGIYSLHQSKPNETTGSKPHSSMPSPLHHYFQGQICFCQLAIVLSETAWRESGTPYKASVWIAAVPDDIWTRQLMNTCLQHQCSPNLPS
jgi:hypothetical protein